MSRAPAPHRDSAARPAALPNLFVAGVAKAGTTSLFDYLRQHPDICASSMKEPYFFGRPGDSRPRLSLHAYADLFRHCGRERYRLEASPHYWTSGARVAEAIVAFDHDARVLISLRDPVRRLWSGYTFALSQGRLDTARSFDDYLDEWASLYEQGNRGAEAERKTLLSIGMYADFLGEWLAALGDRLHVVFAEDLSDRPRGTLEDVFRWLGIDTAPARTLNVTERNTTRTVRSLTLARLSHGARRHANYALRRHQRLLGFMREAYAVLNTTERRVQMSQTSRARATALYRTSNAVTAELLTEQGYRSLPPWLTMEST